MRVGWVLLAAGLAVGQLEAAGVRVLAVGVGAGALVVAQAEGLVPHLGGELRGRRAGRGARLACCLFSVAARAFRGVHLCLCRRGPCPCPSPGLWAGGRAVGAGRVCRCGHALAHGGHCPRSSLGCAGWQSHSRASCRRAEARGG